MKFSDILDYYSKPIVRKEIAEYSKGRWIAIHADGKNKDYFLRYYSTRGPPLVICDQTDVIKLIRRFVSLRPRTFYASINIYSKLSTRTDVEDISNILYTTPIWDIDGSIDDWRSIIEVAKIIVDSLEREGVIKSVYLIWSGRGIHVHINERAFSDEVLNKYHPLDIAYSIVDYILKKEKDKIMAVIKKSTGTEREFKVENEMDMKRVFTVPLSLHKKLDFAAVAFKPEELDDFSLEWANPERFKHNTAWREFVAGEADELAEKAIKEIGGYIQRVGDIRTVIGELRAVTKSSSKGIRSKKKIGRFQVMALLQAARYYLLTGDLQKAKSFGLNRAIFYAWAKHHGKSRIPRRKITINKPIEMIKEKDRRLIYVGDEGAYISDKGWFTIGDKEQRPEDYDREITKKIESVIPYEKAWKKALEYLKKYPKTSLLSQREFFEIYKKVRDTFFDDLISSQ